MQAFMDEVDEDELEGEEEVGAQPGASASLREQSRADVPDVRNTGSASASNSQSHEGADRMAMREDIDALSGPDVSDLVDALLGEMSAVNRHALIVRREDKGLSGRRAGFRVRLVGQWPHPKARARIRSLCG